jgi:hypothetical protein
MTMSFLDLPLEVRTIIYAYSLTSSHTKNPPQPLRPISRDHTLEIRSRMTATDSWSPRGFDNPPTAQDNQTGNFYYPQDPTILDMALLLTCRTVLEEINDYIYRNVKIELRMWSSPMQGNESTPKIEWNKRDKAILRKARRIKINAYLRGCLTRLMLRPVTAAPPDMASLLQRRKNLLEVEFRGSGWWLLANHHGRYVIQRILSQFSKVKSREGVKFTWQDDEHPGAPWFTRRNPPSGELECAEWYRGRVEALANQKC